MFTRSDAGLRHWDWDGMVEANRVRLIGLLAGLLVLMPQGSGVIRRAVWREIVGRLVPLEAALRRLIVVAAIDLNVTLPPVQPFPGNISKGIGSGERPPVFDLTDAIRRVGLPTRKRGPKREPNICFLDEWTPRPKRAVPDDDDLLDAMALRRRLVALRAALDDLPKQAKRLARWMARGERVRKGGTWRRLYPMRSGRPPGHRAHGMRDEDKVLATCHDLALRAREMVGNKAHG